jgi:O-antigen/teichoic acid export membrane protein
MRSERRVIRIARNNIITLSFAIVVSLWLVIIQKLKVDGVLLAGLITSLFKALLYLSDSLRLFSLRFVNTEAMKKLLSYGLPVIPHKLQAQTITLFTIFIINHKLGIVSAGMYAVAQKLAKPLSFIVGMVQQSWTPYKFEMHRTEQKPAIAFRNLISLYWILLLFLWGTLSLAIPFVFKLLINEKYWSGIPYVPFIMFLSVSQGIYFTLMTGFELSDRQYLMVKGSFWGMVSMLGVSLLTLNFYPPYSFILSQSLAFFVMAFVLFPEAKRMINIDYPFIPSFLLLLFTSGCIVLGYSNNSFLMKVGASIFLVFGFALASRFMLPPKIWNKAKTLILKNLQMPITSIK